MKVGDDLVHHSSMCKNFIKHEFCTRLIQNANCHLIQFNVTVRLELIEVRQEIHYISFVCKYIPNERHLWTQRTTPTERNIQRPMPLTRNISTAKDKTKIN